MVNFLGGRPGFRDWIDAEPDPNWNALPLTHISKALVAEDIIRDGCVRPSPDSVFSGPATYFFYGRPAYRVSGDGAIKVAAACPFCFIFDQKLSESPTTIYAFDTGAIEKRMYSRILMEEMRVEDFSLGDDFRRANKLISKVFRTKAKYLKGDVSEVANLEVDAWGFLPRAYLDLISSPGRNEPDDRICSIEFVFHRSVPLIGGVKAIVVPHVLWDADSKTPWLSELQVKGVTISTYEFLPGRNPDYYQALLELQVYELYKTWGIVL